MNDIANQQAIALGNSRRQAVRDLNERIQQHNSDIANQISQAKDQVKTFDTIKKAQDTAQSLWTGSKMPDKIKAFNEYMSDKKASNPTTQSERTTANNAQENTPNQDATTPEQNPTEPPAEPVGEGTNTGETASEEASTATSDIVDGLKNTGAVTEEGAQKLSKLASVGGKVAKGAGVLGAAAIGGLDIYNDIKAKGLAGNNNWEKAGNLLQIGGSFADIAGTVSPPAALLGGVLDLTASALDAIGEGEDTKETDDLTAQQQAETEQQVADPSARAQTL
jgi:hypothetical protein